MKRIALVLLGLTVVAVLAMRRPPGVVQVSDLPPGPPPKGGPEAHTTPVVQAAARPERISQSRRNLFAYELPPPAPVIVTAAPHPQRVAPVVVASTPVVEAPKPPHFPYRYIGRFGPAHDPIAAFAGDGKIVTVRPGDRIDDVFVLRRIGLESVEIEAQGWDRRIPIGFSTEG